MFEFTIEATSSAARTGTLVLPHGTIETPAFMPVGTQGTVRTLSPADLKSVGAQLVLANTYHLHVRPGEGIVERLGGLHRFMGWDRALLTDSGGFQVFSLEGSRRVDEDGVEFQSHVDGSRLYLTPERATEIQWTLGADIAMAFDHVVPGGADEATARDALERTLRWLQRCARRHRELSDGRTVGQSDGQRLPVRPSDGPTVRQALWPILQGGTHFELRTEGLRRIQELEEWTGLAIGGLSVGEPKPVMYEMLERRAPRRPAAARRDVRLRDVRHVLTRLPAAPVRRGGAARAAALVAAQRPVPDPADPGNGGRDPRRNFSAVGRRMAAPLYPIGLTMHASDLLLFTPSGQQGPAGWLVFQLVAVFAIIYFLILRPQKKQQERHRQLLASLQKGDRVVTSGGILGEVVHLKDDEVTVKSGEARLVVVRSNIANILNRSVEAKPQ